MSLDDLSDLELLARWRAGDKASGSALFRRHVTAITNFFRRNIYDRDEVEDLTQETFMALQTSTAEIENVSGYLYRIAFFKFTRHLRRRKNLPDHASDPGDDLEHVAGDLGPDPEYVLTQREDTRLLLRAIRRLALIHQQVLELSFWEGSRARRSPRSSRSRSAPSPAACGSPRSTSTRSSPSSPTRRRPCAPPP